MTMIHILANFIVVWVCRKTLFLWSNKLRPVLPWKLYVHHVIPVGKERSSAYLHFSTLSLLSTSAVFSVLDIGLSNWSLIFITVSL